MSRYTITVNRAGNSDPAAVIGYNPPLKTFFLQAFPDKSGDNLALWIGTEHNEYPTLETLRSAAEARGYTFLPLPAETHAKLFAEMVIASTRPAPAGPTRIGPSPFPKRCISPRRESPSRPDERTERACMLMKREVAIACGGGRLETIETGARTRCGNVQRPGTLSVCVGGRCCFPVLQRSQSPFHVAFVDARLPTAVNPFGVHSMQIQKNSISVLWSRARCAR